MLLQHHPCCCNTIPVAAALLFHSSNFTLVAATPFPCNNNTISVIPTLFPCCCNTIGRFHNTIPVAVAPFSHYYNTTSITSINSPFLQTSFPAEFPGVRQPLSYLFNPESTNLLIITLPTHHFPSPLLQIIFSHAFECAVIITISHKTRRDFSAQQSQEVSTKVRTFMSEH